MHAPILILGVPRSGTSLTAQLVAAWGACAGDQGRLHQADEWNKKGYYEYLPTRDVVNAILKTRLVPAGIDLAPFVPAAREAIRSICAACPPDRPWFWKMPRLSPLLGFWEPLIAEEAGALPFCIVVVRNPISSAQSQKRYFEQKTLKAAEPDFPYAQALMVWQYYMAYLLNHTDPARTLFVSMEDLVADQAAVLRLKAALDQTYGRTGDSAMLAIPQADMVNLKADDLAPLTATQRELYLTLCDLARATGPLPRTDWSHLLPTPAGMAEIEAIERWYVQKLATKFAAKAG
jgi:hypothetical protein